MAKPALRLDQDDFFYQEASVPVIRDIVEFLKSANDSSKKVFHYVWEYPIDPDVWFEYWEDEGHAVYSVTVSVTPTKFDPGHPGWNIDATAGFSEDGTAAIDVNVQLNNALLGDSSIVEKFKTELYNVIPHEMHHLTQKDQPFQRIMCPIVASSKSIGDYRYFTSSCEVPAFLVGFRGESFQSGRPVGELVDSYLRNHLKAGKISASEVEKIKDVWLGHSAWSSRSDESTVREWVKLSLLEKSIRGKGKRKRVLYHIGPRPPRPVPKMKWIETWDAQAIDRVTGEKTGEYVRTGVDNSWQRYWLDKPVESGVFLTPNWQAISSFHGRIGHVYALKVPEWVIEKSGGVHRYDHGSELLISEEIWDEAGDEIEFLGKSVDKSEVESEYVRSYSDTVASANRRGTPRAPSWLNDEQMTAWKARQERFNLSGLRATNHPEDVIKLLKPEERRKAVEAIMAKSANDPGLDEKDEELLALLKKNMNESIIREYVRELLTESRLSGRTIQGVLELLDSHANNTWIFFDTETTGFNPGSRQLTEIGAVAVDPKAWNSDATILGQFNKKIKLDPDTLEAISQQSTKPEDVKGKSIQDLLSMTRYGESGKKYDDEQAVLDQFFEFISSFPNPLLVAQNASFDMKFVNVRSGGKMPNHPVLDTQQLMQGYLIPLLKTQAKAEEGDPEARKLLNKLYVRKGNWGYYSASMGVVSKAYGISIDGWHNALADVKMMMEMYRSVMDTIRKGMGTDISREQGKFLAYQRRRKKRR